MCTMKPTSTNNQQGDLSALVRSRSILLNNSTKKQNRRLIKGVVFYLAGCFTGIFLTILITKLNQ